VTFSAGWGSVLCYGKNCHIEIRPDVIVTMDRQIMSLLQIDRQTGCNCHNNGQADHVIVITRLADQM
jgi:hypothetical protein